MQLRHSRLDIPEKTLLLLLGPMRVHINAENALLAARDFHALLVYLANTNRQKMVLKSYLNRN
jgi:hypothetical protein